MKRFLRLSALFLALAVLLSALSACGGNEAEESSATPSSEAVDTAVTETEEETETELMPEVARNDYGKNFYLWIMDDTNKPRYHWVEESENDVLTEAIFARQQKVYDYLGVEIVGTIRDESYLVYMDPFKTAVKNKDGSVDTMLSHVFSGVASLVSENYLADMAMLPGVNLDADYWNQEFMEDLSIADKYFIGFSDFNILFTYLITFNKTMMDQYADALPKSVYDMVRDYEWTIDQMISLANLVYVDTTADGKSADDVFGITGRQLNEFPGFLHACNVNIVERDETGAYTVAMMNEVNAPKTVALVEKLHELSKADCSYFDYNTTTNITVPLTSGRALLHLSPTLDLANYLAYDVSFGVLPYPLWDTEQKDVGYRHLQWGGYITVPAYLDDAQMTGETLEMLSFYSEDVKTAYYEKMLGKQVADVPDDSEMLSIVWDTVCTEFAQTYYNAMGGENILYLMAHVTEANTTKNVASSVAGMQRGVNGAIAKFIRKVETTKG